MDLNKLKITAGHIVVGSKLNKESKRQLLNFIQKEASESQIMALIMDGKITKLDEQSEEVVKDRFSAIYEQKIVQEIGFIAGVAVLSAGIWAAVRTMKAAVNQAQRKCGAYSIGSKRKVCLAKVKVDEYKKTIGLLKKNMSVCKTTKNPKKCQERTNKAITKIQAKLQKANDKLNKLITKTKPTAVEKGLAKAKTKK